jgi:DmsE family decaheme c-type cytochrome
MRPVDTARSLGLYLVAALAAAGLCALGQTPPNAEKGAASSEQEKAAPEVSGPKIYAGSEVCQGCHEDIFKAFQRNRHHVVEIEKGRGWAGQACEACHGPASKHTESMSAEDIIQPAKAAAREADKICLKCHINQPTHVGRIQGGHGRNEVSCVSCHSIHKGEAASVVHAKPARVNELCTTCHASTWAQFQRPYKHRLPEGAMSCVDCHNPHGGFRPKMIQTANANEPGCMKCHTDKRGPFTFEHAPVKSDGCAACHEPHGSANPRMLVRHEERFLCLECHANVGAPASARTQTIGGIPPAFHDLRSPRYRNCSVCHIKIHGSYVDRRLTR